MKNSTDYDKNSILAFVHIEKAAGTTFVNCLRREFCWRLAEVRPLDIRSGQTFTAEDMKQSLSLNPFLKAITGHSIKPFSNLQNKYENIKYITILRDPVKRYISHYQYWIERKNKDITFDEFLQIDQMKNFQTKKIAGVDDLRTAKKIIREKFLLIGLVEYFDEFMIMLQQALMPYNFNPQYSRTNIAKNNTLSEQLHSKYSEKIQEQNATDTQLYNFVKKEIVPQYRENYGDQLDADLDTFKIKLQNKPSFDFKRNLYYVYKKLYLTPCQGMIRNKNGLPKKGCYGIE